MISAHCGVTLDVHPRVLRHSGKTSRTPGPCVSSIRHFQKYLPCFLDWILIIESIEVR